MDTVAPGAKKSDEGGVKPLYQRVIDAIREQIKTGELTPGDQVGPARTLAETHQVSFITAQRALRDLQDMGLVEAIPGKGSYIRADAIENLPATEPHIQRQSEIIVLQQIALIDHEERLETVEDALVMLIGEFHKIAGNTNPPGLDDALADIRKRRESQSRQDKKKQNTK